MLHARDPQLTLLSDKLRVRDYVAKKGGEEHLIPLLWTGETPEDIPFTELPPKFVIKTNHGCGYVIIAHDGKELDKKNTQLLLNKWLNINFAEDKYLGIAWGYKHIKPCILIEAFLEEQGKPPVDYKFYCFSGRVEIVTLHFDRFEQHKTRAYDREFQPNDFRYDFEQWNGICSCPDNFQEMVRLAEHLSEDFSFMRVDLYNVGGKVYFGEFTPYPGGVATRFLPRTYDYILGRKWKCGEYFTNRSTPCPP